MPVNESNTIQYTVTTTNTADGTTLYWKTTGNTTNSDIVGGNTGSITITNNRAVFNVTVAADSSTDGTKTLGIALVTGSQSGPTVATTPSPIIIEDTSITPTTYSVEYLSVAGGGGGGGGTSGTGSTGGGGGAGGMLTSSANLTSGTSLTITIGAGGAAGPTISNNGQVGTTGANTTIIGTGINVDSFGGGGGGARYGRTIPPGFSYFGGYNGGSGGGGGSGTASYDVPQDDTQALGVSGQGNKGGKSKAHNIYPSTGGGGAGSAGIDAGAYGTPTNGGNGLQNSITGSSIYYAAGGGAGGNSNGVGLSGTGGSGDGGAYTGAPSFIHNVGSNGRVNKGDGAGGGASTGISGSGRNGGTGGSGVVIVRWSDSFPIATSTTGSPTYTNVGGFRIYEFTSSGTITI
jgi:hypothetical protein